MVRYLVVLFGISALFLAFPEASGDEPALLKPTPLEKLNTKQDEDEPHVNSNGLMLFYTSINKGKADVLISARAKKDQPWPAGKPVPDLRDGSDVRSVFLTPEGRYPQHLFFATNYDPERKDRRGDNYDIYYLIRQGPSSEFTTKTAVISVCTAVDELHPWLTLDGRQLYFSRKEKDGWRVYVATRPKDGGNYGKPVRVNLPAGFHHATLDPKGQVMYLQGPLENDRTGLFRSTWNGSQWSKPQPLAHLNHPEGPHGDMSPNLSRDGSMLYFASDRPGGKGGLDLYAIPTAQLDKKK